ncbi:MAG: hypothetical protein KDD34_02750 [Bdellovibrionales bacterium]|nr:hypothetical protein [Bdellovibrionales bacterium]
MYLALKYFFGVLFVFPSIGLAASISLLQGNSYKTYAGKTVSKNVITIDHYGDWSYGNVYFFYDISNGYEAQDRSEFFGSISPSFSMNKIFNKPPGQGLLRDILIKTELEQVSGASHVYYYGLTWDLNIRKFAVANISTVIRDDAVKPGVGGQLNAFWILPFAKKYSFTGFLASGLIPEHKDYVFLMTQPQILYDASEWIDAQTGSTQVGVEYSYGLNRYLKKGVRDSQGTPDPGFNEQVIQAMVKLVY